MATVGVRLSSDSLAISGFPSYFFCTYIEPYIQTVGKCINIYNFLIDIVTKNGNTGGDFFCDESHFGKIGSFPVGSDETKMKLVFR